MFDDFMHNDFPEMHIHQAQQDAMLHAQNQAMDQVMRAQQGMEQAEHVQYCKHAPPASIQNAIMNLRLFLPAIVEQVLFLKQLASSED